MRSSQVLTRLQLIYSRAYSILNPGQVPEAKGVTKWVFIYILRTNMPFINDSNHERFPSQEHVHGSSKIPSVIYYDQKGEIRAIGAETLSEGVYERAEEEGWVKVEWWVCHLQLNRVDPDRS